MNSFLRPIAIVSLLALCAAGCVSALGVVKPSAKNVQAIEITGYCKWKGKSVRLTDPEQIRNILTLIHSVNGMWRMLACGEPDSEETESIRFTIEHPGGPTEVSMHEGMLAAPGEGTSFYTSHKETQAELWNLARQHLGVEDAEPAAAESKMEAEVP